MRRHLGIGPIERRIVETGLDERRLGIARHEKMGNAGDRRERHGCGGIEIGMMSAITAEGDVIPAYQQTADDVLAAFGADARCGLSEAEARRRLLRFGANEMTVERPTPAWRKFLAQFQDVLVILLLIATVISAGSWFYQRETALPYEAVAIAAIVLLNAIMGYVQDARAETAVAALRQMAAARARVIRDGEQRSVTATQIVPGDIIQIEEGDMISADARLLKAFSLEVSEASLTGESLPVSKCAAPIIGEMGIGDRRNMVFSGTTATCGRGRAMVVKTGMQTEFGRIAGLLKETEDETTPLQKEFDRVGRMLGAIVLVIAWR